MENDKLKIFAVIPSGFCFGLQMLTIQFFSNFPASVESLFLLTRWSDGSFQKLLDKHSIPSSYSWLGMFSRKLDWHNLKMSLHALIKLPKLYFDFIKQVRRMKPDILFFANHHELILLYPVLLFTRRKIVCHMHDPAPAIPFQKFTFKFYGAIVDHFIAITESVRTRTIALGCKPEKITVIRNGTGIFIEKKEERFNYFCEKAGWDKDVFIIGITGQMTATKGIMDLLEAFRLVYSRNQKARLLIGGKKMMPLYGELVQRIKEWKLEKVVFFPGWQEDVLFFFKNLDAYVLASRHEEGFGMVVAEAMTAYLPVVVTASGGVLELVEDNVTSFVVEKANPGQMAEKLYELSVDEEKRKRMGLAGRKRIEQHFDIKKQAASMVDLLRKICRS